MVISKHTPDYDPVLAGKSNATQKSQFLDLQSRDIPAN